MSLLALDGVSKRYVDGRREIAVLDDVSVEIDAGDFVGIWGVRRSGKSTLLRVASGEEMPDAGSIRFDGEEITRMSPNRRSRLHRHGGIGIMSSDWRPARNKPAVEHVALPLLSDGMSLHQARAPAWRALERADIAGCAHVPADRLSNSERIRVGLAQALVREPRVLLVDEPAVLLRPSEGAALYELLQSLGRDRDLAIVVTSEDVAPIRTARRMFTIDSGRLRAMDEPGTVVELRDRQHR
jgi:putative ABC transport system ATP-binding protein